jgi:hypothetical protein
MTTVVVLSFSMGFELRSMSHQSRIHCSPTRRKLSSMKSQLFPTSVPQTSVSGMQHTYRLLPPLGRRIRLFSRIVPIRLGKFHWADSPPHRPLVHRSKFSHCGVAPQLCHLNEFVGLPPPDQTNYSLGIPSSRSHLLLYRSNYSCSDKTAGVIGGSSHSCRASPPCGCRNKARLDRLARKYPRKYLAVVVPNSIAFSRHR